jgi:5'-nucleotidase/UDP-sugar diphosphatase
VKNGDRTTLVVQAYQWGEFVGRIDLTIDHDKITSYNGHLIQITKNLKEDPHVAATVAYFTRKLEARMDKVVANANSAMSEEGKRQGDIPLGDLIADAMREQTHTDIALMNSGGIRADLPKGPITTGMIYSLLPFPNALVTFKAKGSQVGRIVDALVARSKREGLAMQVSGLQLLAKGGKTQSVQVGGVPLEPNKLYTVSTIDYVAAGNDGWDAFKEVKATPTGLLLRDAFFNYLKVHPQLNAPAVGRIQLQP